MQFDKFTLKAQEALATAQQIAMAKSNTVLSPLHLLIAILRDDDGIVVMILKRIGANITRIKEMTDSEIDRLATGNVDAQIMPDPAFGARPLKRTIQQRLENKLAAELLEGKFAEGDTIKIDANAHNFTFKKINS